MAGLPSMSDELLAGRRALEGIEGVAILADWQWHDGVSRWVLHVRLKVIVSADSRVPASTDWFVLVDKGYPAGTIRFYPAKEGGLQQTFPHQARNDECSDPHIPWRAGFLCLDPTVRVLGRHGGDGEPAGVHRRLQWHFRRALRWLTLASRNELLRHGEPYELPQFPVIDPPQIAFYENAGSCVRWATTFERFGLVDIHRLAVNEDVLVASRFRSPEGAMLVDLPWGDGLAASGAEQALGIWIRLDAAPVMAPWQAPATWGELRQAVSEQAGDLDSLMKPALRPIRDGMRHVALFGFAIPKEVGGTPARVHWQGCLMPQISHGRQTMEGFRAGKEGQWQRDRRRILTRKTPVVWLKSRNWAPDQIQSRGRLPRAVRDRRFIVIGAGALGAVVAELLVRSGVNRMVIIDSDKLEIGNLTRHTLGIGSIGQAKAQALADHLNNASPHAAVVGIEKSFPPSVESDIAALQSCDVVVDCTGEDDVLRQATSFPWRSEKLFCSISLGCYARRLFCYTARREQFPLADFKRSMGPWLELENAERSHQEFPWEAIGCWHPVFPARADDVWMMASVAVRHLEAAIHQESIEPSLSVFKQQSHDGMFTGIRRTEGTDPHDGHAVLE